MASNQQLAVGLHHLPQLLLEVGYLITQPGRELELQIGRGGMHLGGEFLHQIRQIASRYPCQPPGLGAHILGAE